METVAIACFDGFDELDALGPYEVFENAVRDRATWDVDLCTVRDRPTVTAAHGLTVAVDGTLGDATPDLLVVPGGGWTDGADEGARAEVDHGRLPDAVSAAHDAGATVAGVCTGGLVVEAAGLLDGRPAVTHGDAMADLRASDADPVDARVVDDGDVLTAGGVTAGLDLALHVVAREWGSSVADAVATRMEYDTRGRVHRAE